MKLVKNICLKIWDEVESHLAKYIAGFIIVIIGAFCMVFWKWLKTKHSLEIYGLEWLLILLTSLFLFCYFLRSMLYNRGRLKNPRDIINAIDDWFTRDINHRTHIDDRYRPYYFASVEKKLNLKRGGSKIYLPMIAWKHGYSFETGRKTFRLTNLTHENDPTFIFEQIFNDLSTEKEIRLSCNVIDKGLGWPEGASKSFLLNRPPKNERFEIEIQDIGRDKIRIIRKK